MSNSTIRMIHANCARSGQQNGGRLSNIYTGTINRGSGAQCTCTFKDKRGEEKKRTQMKKTHNTDPVSSRRGRGGRGGEAGGTPKVHPGEAGGRFRVRSGYQGGSLEEVHGKDNSHLRIR